MKKFQWINDYALKQKGDDLEASLPKPVSDATLKKRDDAWYLSKMSWRIFCAGLNRKMVDNKWPAFEEVFLGFEPEKLVLFSDERLEKLMDERRIIRHWGKIKSVRANAQMILDTRKDYSSFGAFLAAWPESDIVGLWQYFGKNGKQLGGNSGPYFLRIAGKDTFILTGDVVAALIAQGIITKKPTSKRDLQAVQDAFNQWREQGGRPLCQISRMLSYTIG